jgi:alkylation response protein AidB-like acyl-CoA dehydrogenase
MLQSALDYALHRIGSTGPSPRPAQQEKLARMVTELTKGQLLAPGSGASRTRRR